MVSGPRIKVACEWGEQFDIQVLLSDTVASWKAYVAEHTAVPIWQQTWVYNGAELADGDRVRIPNSATIKVQKKRFTSFVFVHQPPARGALCAKISALREERRHLLLLRQFAAFLNRDRFAEFKSELARLCSQPVRSLAAIPVDVCVGSETFHRTLKQTDSVRDLKLRLLLYGGVECELSLKGVQLEDDEPIGSFQLNSSTPIRATPIAARPARTVQPEDTLHGLYEELHYEQKEMQEAVVLPPSDCWKWSAEVERLIACFKEERPTAQPRFVVYVRVVATDRTVVVAGVFNSCTMQQIKEVVQQLDGVSAESQRLFYGEKELENECTLKEADIKNEATLHSLGFISGSQLLRQVPRPAKRLLPPFAHSAFGGIARQAEREFGDLKCRLRALRELLVFAEADEELQEAVRDEYANILADRKKAKEPQVDARLVDEWRRTVDDLSDELRRTKIAEADGKLQLANCRRELEELRRLVDRRV